MKYQIVLECTNKHRPADDEFEKLVKKNGLPVGFKLLYARSLEGIRPEVYSQPAKKTKYQEGDFAELAKAIMHPSKKKPTSKPKWKDPLE